MYCPNCGAYNADTELRCFHCKYSLPKPDPQGYRPMQQARSDGQYRQNRQPPYQQPPYPPYGQQPPVYGQPYPPPPPGYREVNKIAAGLLAIFLGGLGIHKFYLGDKNGGILYLCLSLGGVLCAMLFFWLIFPLFLLLAPVVIEIIALVEGITYLCMSDYDFQMKYGTRY